MLLVNLQKEGTISRILNGFHDFLHALFESFLYFYDPLLKGHLEVIEDEIEKMIVSRIIVGDLYHILLVMSRV